MLFFGRWVQILKINQVRYSQGSWLETPLFQRSYSLGPLTICKVFQITLIQLLIESLFTRPAFVGEFDAQFVILLHIPQETIATCAPTDHFFVEDT